MQTRLSLFFGVFALFFAASPGIVRAGAGDPFVSIGVSQSVACGTGSFLVGFQGHIGVWIDQMQPICARWDAKRGQLGDPIAGDVFGNAHGGGVDLKQAICRPGNVVVGLRWGIATPNGPPGHIQNLGLQCASVQDPNNWQGSRPDLGSANFQTEKSFCARGLVASGIDIWLDGINITSLTLQCDNAPRMAALSNPPIRLGHDTHGSAGPMVAPRPTVAGSSVIEGQWRTTEGNMRLKQTGDHLAATYGSNNGMISADRDGSNWVGFWAETISNHKCADMKLGSYYWGNIEMTFTDQNSHFEAMWSYCSAPIAGGVKWTGDRVQ